MNTTELKTLGDLQFEKFNVKDETRPSIAIPFSTFVNTKHSYKGNTPIPESGLQIMQGINEVLNNIIPDTNRNWGNIYVYKSQFEAPNYAKRLTGKEPEGYRLLTPDVPITDLYFPRFIGTIDLVGNGKYTERIAIKSDNNKSIQLAIGLNVNVCDNFTLFGQNLLNTNTREKRGFEWIMQCIEDYCKSIQEKFKYDIKTIHRLEETPISHFERDRFVGELLMNYETKDEVLPVTMITDLSRQLRKQPVSNAWELLNAGTEIVRFDSNTGDSIMETMHSFANFTIQKAGIEYEFAV